jgi:zinc transporter ZupT
VALFALAAPIGFILSDMILAHLSPIFTGLITAFAWGSLLYVATADLLPVIHSQTNKKYITVSVFILGTLAMSSMKLLEWDHGHHEEKDSIHTEIHTQ